jgi:hypothetical protein
MNPMRWAQGACCGVAVHIKSVGEEKANELWAQASKQPEKEVKGIDYYP